MGFAQSVPTTCSMANASYDPQPDWVDLNKVAIPQADEQQRLLANLIIADELRPQTAATLLVFPERRTRRSW